MDLIIYANVMVKQFPKHEKYQLAARIMGLCYDLLEAAVATGKRLHKKTTLTEMNIKHEVLRQLVSHAKGTASLASVSKICTANAPEHKMATWDWRARHA